MEVKSKYSSGLKEGTKWLVLLKIMTLKEDLEFSRCYQGKFRANWYNPLTYLYILLAGLLLSVAYAIVGIQDAVTNVRDTLEFNVILHKAEVEEDEEGGN